MYLKLLGAFCIVFSVNIFAQSDVSELFDDSIAIELESFGGSDIEADIDNLLGKRPKEAYGQRGEQSGEWKIDENAVDPDKVSFKDQSRSLINWKTIKHESWFDFGGWLQNREYKDNNPDWKVQLRDTSHREAFGKVIKCIGNCKIFRGEEYVQSEFRSNLNEGDEILVEEDSYAWIYLMDGSLLRLSPLTSLSFNEINFSQDTSFKYLRLNYGNIHLRPWLSFDFKKQEMIESDLYFLPLMIKESNREFYARESYQTKTDLEKIQENLVKLPGLDLQYKKLEELSKVQRKVLKNQLTFIVTPVGSLETKNQFVDVFYQFKNEAWLRVKNNLENQKIVQSDIEQYSKIYFRGYNNLEEGSLVDTTWYQMSSDGKQIVVDDSFQEKYNFIDTFTKRIFTIELARQLWSRKYNTFLLSDKIDEKELAEKFGYRLWSTEDLNKRMSFLKEYTRRVETTNLGAMEKVASKIGMEPFGEKHYKYALKNQIEKLKEFYNKKHMLVKSMNDLDYYVWLLKNAK